MNNCTILPFNIVSIPTLIALDLWVCYRNAHMFSKRVSWNLLVLSLTKYWFFTPLTWYCDYWSLAPSLLLAAFYVGFGKISSLWIKTQSEYYRSPLQTTGIQFTVAGRYFFIISHNDKDAWENPSLAQTSHWSSKLLPVLIDAPTMQAITLLSISIFKGLSNYCFLSLCIHPLQSKPLQAADTMK